MQICQSLIDGKPVTSPLASIDKIYPATGEVIAKIEPATREMLDEAVAVAAVAQRSWAAVEPLKRARVLHRAAALMRETNAELARLEVMDVGKLYSEAESADVPSGTDAFDFFANIHHFKTRQFSVCLAHQCGGAVQNARSC